MANRAYWGLWSTTFCAATMLEQFEKVLGTVPFSAERPGLTGLVVRAVDPSETPLVDVDLRPSPLSPAEWIAIAREHANSDCVLEAEAFWDLWAFDDAKSRWQRAPQRIEIYCHGEDYDGGVWAEVGHFQADVGFEHLFTGHARLLGPNPEAPAAPQDAAELRFQRIMSVAENLREYHHRTQENIQALTEWLRKLEGAVAVERYHLRSEGEENFEARVDEILAVR